MNIKEIYLQFKEDGFDFENQEVNFVELSAYQKDGETFLGCTRCRPQTKETIRVAISINEALKRVCDCAWGEGLFVTGIHRVVTQWVQQRQAFFNALPETFSELYDLTETIDQVREFNSYKTTRQWKQRRNEIIKTRVEQIQQKVQTIPLAEIVSFYQKVILANIKDKTKLAVGDLVNDVTGGTQLVEEFTEKFVKAATEDTERKIKEQTENPQYFLVDFNAANTIERMLFPSVAKTNLTIVPQAALEFAERPYQQDSKYLVKLKQPLTIEDQEILSGIYNPSSDGPYNDLRNCYHALKTLT